MSLSKQEETGQGVTWTFLTNHSHVLVCLARDPLMRLRDVAEKVGITERAVQRIVADLEGGGVITRIRDGRRNHYQIHAELPLRHPIEKSHTIGELLTLVSDLAPTSQPDTDREATADRNEEKSKVG